MSNGRLFTLVFARVWLATLGAFTTFGMLVLALPLYVKDELNGGSVEVGLAMGAGSLTAVIGSPLCGRLADRRGRRKVMLTGGLVMVACYLALAAAPPLSLVVLIRLAAGAGEAALIVGLYTVATDLTPAERHGEAMSLVTLASYLGLTIGPVASDLVLGGGRYGLVWFVAAGLVALALVGLWPVPETMPEPVEEVEGRWLPPRGALAPGLLVLVGLFGFGGFLAFAALYARQVGIGHPGLVLTVFGGTVACVRLFGRRLPDRVGARTTIAYSFVILAAGLSLVGIWHSAVGLVVGTIVFGVGQALVYPSAVLLAIEATSIGERSAAVGSVGAFVDVALGFGAVVLGAVASVTSYRGAFVVAALISLSGLAVLAPLRNMGRLPAEEPAP